MDYEAKRVLVCLRYGIGGIHRVAVDEVVALAERALAGAVRRATRSLPVVAPGA